MGKAGASSLLTAGDLAGYGELWPPVPLLPDRVRGRQRRSGRRDQLCPRLPPSSRAMSAASVVVAAAASAEGVRNRRSDPGASVFIARDSNGTSGGWSG